MTLTQNFAIQKIENEIRIVFYAIKIRKKKICVLILMTFNNVYVSYHNIIFCFITFNNVTTLFKIFKT